MDSYTAIEGQKLRFETDLTPYCQALGEDFEPGMVEVNYHLHPEYLDEAPLHITIDVWPLVIDVPRRAANQDDGAYAGKVC